MKNKRNQYLTALLACTIVAFKSYGQGTLVPGGLSIIQAQEGQDAEQEDKEKEIAPIQEKAAFYGSASLEVAKNFGLRYPAQTDFNPSLIMMKKKQSADNLAFDAGLKLGFEKFFNVENKQAEMHVEISASQEKAKLTTLYFAKGVFEGSKLFLGLKKNNFCTISASPSAANVLQVGWSIPFEAFELGFSIEQAKDLEMYPKSVKEEDRDLKPTKELPAVSARLGYSLPDEIGNMELSGLFRSLEWSGDKKFTFRPGYGANLGMKFNLQPRVCTLTLNALYGSAIGSYIGDISSLEDEEHSVYVKDNGRVSTLDVFGSHADLEYKWTPVLTTHLKGGVNTMLNAGNATTRPDAYSLGYYIMPNFTYSLTDKVDVGFEYALGSRMNLNDKTQAANHIKVFGSFSFRTETEDEKLQI
jgi:hypothetical protein